MGQDEWCGHGRAIGWRKWNWERGQGPVEEARLRPGSR